MAEWGSDRTRFQLILIKFWSYKGNSCSRFPQALLGAGLGAWMPIIPHVALSFPPPRSVSLSARIRQSLRMEPLKCYETGIGNPFPSSCQAGEGAWAGGWGEGRRFRKGECNVSAGVTTQPLRCPQPCAHHSSGRQMEGRWTGTEAALGRARRSQQPPGWQLMRLCQAGTAIREPGAPPAGRWATAWLLNLLPTGNLAFEPSRFWHVA